MIGMKVTNQFQQLDLSEKNTKLRAAIGSGFKKRCKIIDFKKTGDIGNIGCQSIYPTWTAEQFKVKMGFERNGGSCTCIRSPISRLLAFRPWLNGDY